MTIIFNPCYDSSVFLTAADCSIGKAYQGKEALLSELELRAGLTGAATEHADRVIAYMEAMQAAATAAASPLFYVDSFAQDDYGTAELMLSWRDTLVKAGWDGAPAGKSEKIRVLSLIESCFNSPGPADRWRAILKEAAARPILRPTDRISVQCTRNELEPVLLDLFDSINAHYATPVVEYLPTSATSQEVIPRCQILSFDNEYEAHEWIASLDLGGDDVLAEADQALMGDVLGVLGKPGIGAADEGIGAVMRLLPLGVSLFQYPVDISKLMSYLQTPRTPLGKLHTQVTKKDGSFAYPSAARLLYEHLCSAGGLGQPWKDILDEARYAWDGTPLTAKERQQALTFIDMWEKSKTLPAGEASTADIISYVEGLAIWAAGNLGPDMALNAQFVSLERNCRAMLRLLGGWKGTSIPVERLRKWAAHICAPVNISSDYARLGSMNIVPNVADIYSRAQRLVWFASTTGSALSSEYDFLSHSEVSDLLSSGVHIPDKRAQALADKALKLVGLCRCERITIVTCRHISGVETIPGALLAEIADSVPATKGMPVAKLATGKVESDFGKKEIHRFDPAILQGFSRDKESYSSINTLLMTPVDYLLNYFKEYKEYGREKLSDLNTTEGNVAHAYIETLGERCAYKPADMMALHRTSFNTLLDEVIAEKGLLLCLEMNSLEEKSFRLSLQESVRILLGIISDNALEIEGFEYEATTVIPNIGKVTAKIDCLLKDPSDGKYVIIDFKYNSGLTYRKKIENDRELQLAVYRKVVEKELGEVKFTGYYAIPRKTLFTADDVLKPNGAIEQIAKTAPVDIFTMAEKGYVFRWSQLHQGILEEGEGLPITNLDYGRQTDVFPLESDYANSDLKAIAYGNKNITLKGGLV